MTPDSEDLGLTERFEVRITPAQLDALKADAKRFGRKPAQSARFAIDFYLAATPPITVTEQRDPGPLELGPLVGHKRNANGAKLEWDQDFTSDGRFAIDSEQVRGEPRWYCLRFYDKKCAEMHDALGLDGSTDKRQVKRNAQRVADAVAAPPVTVTPASQDGTNG